MNSVVNEKSGSRIAEPKAPWTNLSDVWLLTAGYSHMKEYDDSTQ
jgi:hypothetical protein